MRTRMLCSLSFALGLLTRLSINVIAKNNLDEPYGDNIFCWFSDVPYNARTNTVGHAETRLSGTGGIKVNTILTGGSKFTLGHYEVSIDGSGIESGGSSWVHSVNVDHDFNASVSGIYFVSRPATCTLPSAVDAAGKEVLVWNACTAGGSVNYGTSAKQLISGKQASALANPTPYTLDRFISDGSN